ncbi:phosphatase PAP2 family protein [candidate division KSB1 bacterium]|nr:phosphatase PAP2 family protein [candidate division KSB1 bacterium]
MLLIDRYHHLRFRLVDLNCLGYMVLLNLLLPFLHWEVPHWWRDFLIHLFFVTAGLEIVRLGERRPQNRFLRFLRIFYPLAFIAYGYFANFLLFYFFPALSPRMMPWLAAMHSAAEPTGYFFASLTRLVQGQEQGAIHGGCFPSSHVAGALAWSLAAWRYNRKVSYFLFPLVAGVAVSTVYLRYHHALDPLFGIILGFICYPVAVAILRKRREESSQRTA